VRQRPSISHAALADSSARRVRAGFRRAGVRRGNRVVCGRLRSRRRGRTSLSTAAA